MQMSPDVLSLILTFKISFCSKSPKATRCYSLSETAVSYQREQKKLLKKKESNDQIEHFTVCHMHFMSYF